MDGQTNGLALTPTLNAPGVGSGGGAGTLLLTTDAGVILTNDAGVQLTTSS